VYAYQGTISTLPQHAPTLAKAIISGHCYVSQNALFPKIDQATEVKTEKKVTLNLEHAIAVRAGRQPM
jgi:hypothetical protein